MSLVVTLLVIVLCIILLQYIPGIPPNIKQLLMIVVVIVGALYLIAGAGVLKGL